ncbi:YicS family protein [Escherichia coli]|uniref:YicS family protein n=1 Tax=Escherichia coli TaxID=562 RepID=UPI002DBAD832|nr:YicS family protein [Escherichia coli]MEC4256452.1 YicS family protein [Escherichia coli]
MKYLIPIVLMLLSQTPALANSAYENLAFALRQQKISDDLRHKCQIPTTVTDEQLQRRFLDSTHDNSAVLSAVKALTENNQKRYQTFLSQVKCPQ